MICKMDFTHNKKRSSHDVYHIPAGIVFKNMILIIMTGFIIAFCLESIFSYGRINWLKYAGDYFRVAVFIVTFNSEILNYNKILNNMKSENYTLDSGFRTTLTIVSAVIYGCMWIAVFNISIYLLVYITGIKYNVLFGAQMMEALIVGVIHGISFYFYQKLNHMVE